MREGSHRKARSEALNWCAGARTCNGAPDPKRGLDCSDWGAKGHAQRMVMDFRVK